MIPRTNKNIVLDMDETIIHTFEKTDPSLTESKNEDISHRLFKIKIDGSNMIGVFRPHLQEFIDFCFSYFKRVFIYSAGEDKYVKSIIEIVFSPMCIEHILEGNRCPTEIWTRESCKTDSKGFLIKPLELLYDRYPDMNEKNTFIVDDRETTFVKNPDNAIHIPEYVIKPRPGELRMDRDNRLKELMKWFMRSEVIFSQDVRKLDKSRIFK